MLPSHHHDPDTVNPDTVNGRTETMLPELHGYDAVKRLYHEYTSSREYIDKQQAALQRQCARCTESFLRIYTTGMENSAPMVAQRALDQSRAIAHIAGDKGNLNACIDAVVRASNPVPMPENAVSVSPPVSGWSSVRPFACNIVCLILYEQLVLCCRPMMTKSSE